MFTGNFIGRVGKDAEVVQGVNGTEFVSMDIAESYYAKGETKTRWIRVRCSTPRALKMAKYWTKGRQLEVVGELANINIYEDSQGKHSFFPGSKGTSPHPCSLRTFHHVDGGVRRRGCVPPGHTQFHESAQSLVNHKSIRTRQFSAGFCVRISLL